MLIDINASFGGNESIQRFDVQRLESELSRTPCTRAYVSCREAIFDQRAGNDHLFEVCAKRPAWRPAATIQPRDTFVWEEEFRRCLQAGVRLFRITPELRGWPIEAIFLDQIVDALAETGAVLIVDATTPGLASRLAPISADADLPVVFTEARYFPLTELFPVAQRYPNVFIESGRLTSPGGLELWVRELGPSRVLYGSGACRYPAAIAWRMLERADISDEDREAIAWGNAARILQLDLGEVPSPAVKAPAIPSVITSPGGETPALPLPVEHHWPAAIDIHLHDKFPGGPFPPFAAGDYEAELSRNGVAAGVCSSATAIFYDLKLGNDENQRLLESVPRLRGYIVVDPRYPEDSAAELTRFDTSDVWIGVKVHCAHARTETSSRALENLLSMVSEHGKPLLIHPLGSDWPEALGKLAAWHPGLQIIAAHAGYGDAPHPTHDASLRLADQPNIALEFCSTYLTVGAIRRGIDAVGIERVLFGSDFPLISLEYMRIAYEEAELTQEESRMVFLQNAVGMFPKFFSLGEGSHDYPEA